MSPNNSNILVKQQFNSFEEFAELAVAWNADFRQLDAEQFKSDMFQAQIGTILISSARLGCNVEQRGSVPLNMRTFAVPDKGSPGLRWFGKNVGADSLLCFPAHGEIDVFSRPGFSVTTFSIAEDVLEDLLERNGIHELAGSIGTSRIVFPSQSPLLDRLRHALRIAANIAHLGNGNRILIRDFQEQIHSALIQVIDDGKSDSTICTNLDSTALEPVLEHINAHAKTPLRIADLCSVSGVSERSLQYHFKKNLGMTPKSYLAGRRLYGAHRDLWHSQPKSTRISDVANRWGYWHMGQFAADYRRVFSELPSTTLKRTL